MLSVIRIFYNERGQTVDPGKLTYSVTLVAGRFPGKLRSVYSDIVSELPSAEIGVEGGMVRGDEIA